MSLFKVLKKYFHFVNQEKGLYYTVMFLILITSVAAMVNPAIYGKLIDRVEDYDYALKLILALAVLMIGGELLSALTEYLKGRTSVKALDTKPRLEYLKAIQNLDYDYHVNKSSGKLISIVNRATSALDEVFSHINCDAFSILIKFVTSFFILLYIQPVFALGILLTFLASFFASLVLIKINIKRRRIFIEEYDKVNALEVDNLLGFETVKLFGQEEHEMKRFKNAFVSYTKSFYPFLKTYSYIIIVLGVISNLGIVFILYFGIKGVHNNSISVGSLVAALVYIFDLYGSNFKLMNRLRTIGKFYIDIQKFFEILNIKPKIKDSNSAFSLEKVRGFVEFNNLSFRYSTKNREALREVSLEVRPNEIVALVGKSGSGKTTLTKLLMRFYEPTSGTIRIDGHDYRQIKIESLRKAIGLVPQDPVLFNDTIGYNIAYGKINASLEEIKRAAEKAQLHSFIKSLPQGYQTIVGERGIKLSGGQKQRLAIARVILKDPEIIVFDEATSQLDSENERAIQQAFAVLTKNKTTLIIAHRLSTIMHADRIIVFENGKIVQQGKHLELIKQAGVYKHLWELQTEALTI